MSAKNGKQLKDRRSFINLSVNDPKRAALLLRRKAKGLENCRNTSDSVEALKDILYVSEVTIFRDLAS